MNQENSLEIIKEEIAPGIFLYSDIIPNSDELFNKIKKAMIDPKWIVPRWSYADATDLEKNIELNLNKIFFKYFDPIEKDYKDFYKIFPEWHDVYGIMKYSVGEEFINHMDDSTEHHRQVSVVYYLNDNYIGGEINFPRFNITIKPKANQMILFPSSYVYNHFVSPIIEGEKYAVVSWLR
jgi:hypothetical protein